MTSKSSNNKFLNEVTKAFLAAGKPVSKNEEFKLQQKWFKGTRYRIYNIKRKDLKALLKKEFSFSHLSKMEIAKIWSYIFKNTEYMDLGLLAINYFKQFQNKKSHPVDQYWPIVKTWVSYIENWDHGDMLSGIYCDCLSARPDDVYPYLVKWSKHKSPWKNRMGMLSLLYYYNVKNPKRNLLPYKNIIALVDPHLKKEHYYLQKAVGWTLRELLKAHPKKAWSYITKNVTTLVENVPESKKKGLKETRKKYRASLKKK